MYSVECRLKPRLEVLEILKRKNLLVEKTKLTSLLVLWAEVCWKIYSSLCKWTWEGYDLWRLNWTQSASSDHNSRDMYYEDLVKFSIFGVSGNLMDHGCCLGGRARNWKWRSWILLEVFSLLYLYVSIALHNKAITFTVMLLSIRL